MSGILVYALHYEGAFNKNSLGAVSEGGVVESGGVAVSGEVVASGVVPGVVAVSGDVVAPGVAPACSDGVAPAALSFCVSLSRLLHAASKAAAAQTGIQIFALAFKLMGSSWELASACTVRGHPAANSRNVCTFRRADVLPDVFLSYPPRDWGIFHL